MKTPSITIALFLSIITPLMSQTPAPVPTAAKENEVKKLTSNDITLEAMSHIKSIFASAATGTDVEKATAAATSIKATTEKIVALQSILKASPMPTVEEKKAFAQKMLQYEPQVSVIIKKMTKTFDTNPKEVNKIIEPAITDFQEKIKPMTALINTYYPVKEMDGYMDELRGK